MLVKLTPKGNNSMKTEKNITQYIVCESILSTFFLFFVILLDYLMVNAFLSMSEKLKHSKEK